MKIVCGKCGSEVELPKDGEGPDVTCPSCGVVFRMPSLAEGETLPHPDTFPGYRIVAIIGHGGMGAVYRAIQLSMEREVAVKVLLRKYSHVPRFVARFEREATALAALSHSNIVAVIDRARVDDTYYFVMEYVHGRTLRTLIKQDRLSVERSVDFAVQICRALEAAHGAGVVHRDIKPGNVLVQDDGQAKVADFGIAHMVDDDKTADTERRSRLGTAKYMAPEQRGLGDVVDPRADIYALGITLFEMLTGTVPHGEPASSINAVVPHELDAICDRAVRQDRDERYPTAAALREDLERVLADLRRAEPPPDAPPLPEGALCPTCARPVAPTDLVCPHCDAQIAELCFHPHCRGINPVGIERCLECNGHVELLRRRREAELAGLIDDATAHARQGRFARALRDLGPALADRHVAFQNLRDRARDLAALLRRRRRRALLRNSLTAAGVLIAVAAAGVAGYWGVHRLLARNGKPRPDPVPPGPRVVPATDRPTVRPKPPPSRRHAFRDYLLAATDGAWAKTAPELRILVAARAFDYLREPSPQGPCAERLADTLANLTLGNVAAPTGRALHGHLFRALDSVVVLVAARLRRYSTLAAEVHSITARHRQLTVKAESRPRQLALAAGTLDDLLAAAERRLNPKPDAAARRLLLAASVAPVEPRDDGLHGVATRLTRAARLLVRCLRRGADPGTALELLDDALGRLDRADREPSDVARLAHALEALAEALAAHASVP